MIAFYLFAAVTLGAALLVVGQRNPMYSVLLLIASFGGLAGLYVLLDAPFVAVIQIIVYAGAIMVLFLFVVMLLAAPVEEAPRPGTGASRWWGLALAAALGVELLWALGRMAPAEVVSDAESVARLASVRELGVAIFTRHAFAFEATSVLILVALVGAVVLARREEERRP